MQPQKQKVTKVKSYEKEDYERDQKRKIKRTKFLGVDFAKIESAPVSDLERETQVKITKKPEALQNLIREEQKALLYKALCELGLPPSEHRCLSLNLKGYTPKEIARDLKITGGAVRAILVHARERLIQFAKKRYRNFESL